MRRIATLLVAAAMLAPAGAARADEVPDVRCAIVEPLRSCGYRANGYGFITVTRLSPWFVWIERDGSTLWVLGMDTPYVGGIPSQPGDTVRAAIRDPATCNPPGGGNPLPACPGFGPLVIRENR